MALMTVPSLRRAPARRPEARRQTRTCQRAELERDSALVTDLLLPTAMCQCNGMARDSIQIQVHCPPAGLRRQTPRLCCCCCAQAASAASSPPAAAGARPAWREAASHWHRAGHCHCGLSPCGGHGLRVAGEASTVTAGRRTRRDRASAWRLSVSEAQVQRNDCRRPVPRTLRLTAATARIFKGLMAAAASTANLSESLTDASTVPHSCNTWVVSGAQIHVLY
jgi:hypothetical protein